MSDLKPRRRYRESHPRRGGFSTAERHSITGVADDPQYPRRVAISFALAIAATEVFVGALSFLKPPKPPVEEKVAAAVITIDRRPRPTPTPMPVPTPRPTEKPRPTPKPTVALTPRPVPSVVIVPKSPAPKLAARVALKHGGAAAPIAHHSAAPKRIATTTGGTNEGVLGKGTGSGAGAGRGSGGGGGTATGSGGNGSGLGALGAADAPCGSPVIIGLRAKYRPDGSFAEDVRVQVPLRNGQLLEGDFPYPFIYPSEQANPFSRLNMGKDFDIPIQLPPAGFDASQEPLAVQYTLKYSGADGLTRLPQCPHG